MSRYVFALSLSAYLLKLIAGFTFFISLQGHADSSAFKSKTSKTITFVADYWPPFNNEPDSDMEGYMIEIAKAVFESKGYEVVYKNLPWNRSIIESRKGRFNAIIGATKKEAPDFIFPEEELGHDIQGFYVRKDSNWRFENVSSLEEVYLGVIDGYDYRDWFKEYERIHPDKVYVRYGQSPLKENLRLLINGRLGAVIDNDATLRWVSKEMEITDQVKSGGLDTVGGGTSLYLAFSPSLPTSRYYSQLLSGGIREMRKNGRLQTILDRYGIQDWQKK